MSVLLETANVLREIADWLRRTPWHKEAEHLDVWIKELDMPCVIAVSGMVKAGKSSFINALLGEDLTVVGATETTATINKIQYSGSRRESSQSVKCCWSDGRMEWKDQSFLKALQGKDALTLQTAAEIDHLDYFVDNPMLSQVSIIDTPGYGAYTGKDGNAHEETLRKWHTKQTRDITAGADAVIFLLDSTVANFTETDVDFLTGADKKAIFTRDRAIFLISKSDRLDEATRNRQAVTLRKKLGESIPDLRGSVFLPISAEVQRIVDSLSDSDFQNLFSDIKANLSGENDIGLRVESRFPVNTERLANLKKRFDWGAVKTIATAMVLSKDCSMALERIRAISGFSILRDELNRIFFERTSVLRCSRVIHAVLDMIHKLQDYDISRYRVRRDAIIRFMPKLEEAISHLEASDGDAASLLTDIVNAEKDSYSWEPEVLLKELNEHERSVERLLDGDSTLHLLDVLYRVREVFESNRELFERYAETAGLEASEFMEVDSIAKNFAAFKEQGVVNVADKIQKWDYYKDVAGDPSFKEFSQLAAEVYRHL